MSEYSTAVANSAAIIAGVPGVVNVYPRMRLATRPDQVRALFGEFVGPDPDDFRIHSWLLTRTSVLTARNVDHRISTHTIRATGFLSFSDALDSETEFNEEIESVRIELERHAQNASGGGVDDPSAIHLARPPQVNPIDLREFCEHVCMAATIDFELVAVKSLSHVL